MINTKNKHIVFAAAVCLLVFLYLFGKIGLKLGIFLIAVTIPFYFMLKKAEFENIELIAYSIIAGIIVTSSLTYGIGLYLSSLTKGFAVSYLIILIFAAVVNFVDFGKIRKNLLVEEKDVIPENTKKEEEKTKTEDNNDNNKTT